MESGERTEKATPKKRRDARNKGQVRKSAEIVTAIMMLAMFTAISLFGRGLFDGMTEIMRDMISGGHTLFGEAAERGLNVGDIPVMTMRVVLRFMLMLLPLLGIAFVTAIVANVGQVGYLFSTQALAPKMSRINPLSGIKRMFSFKALFDLVKAIIKVVIIGYIAYLKYVEYMDRFFLMTAMSPIGAAMDIAEMVFDIGYTIAFALLFLAALDYVYQWFKYEKDLRMTKYEVKMEAKQQEGDPQIKGRIRQKQRQMAMMRMMQDVPSADVVITNPTHYAVALKYDEAQAAAPIVVAKGKDFLAARIKEIAKESGVEIVENVEVAQGLYALCEVGSEVPFALFQAVAEILAFVYKKKNKL